METENKKRKTVPYNKRRPYNKNNLFRYSVTLDYTVDGTILDELYKIKHDQDNEISQLVFIKYAIFKKMNRNITVNTIDLKSKKSKYSSENEKKTVNLTHIDKDLINALPSKQAGVYIKEALYELIKEGYTKEQLKDFKNERKKLREKNPIIMKPQFSLYEKNEKDMIVKDIIEHLDQVADRDEFIKNAIIEKYNKDFQKDHSSLN